MSKYYNALRSFYEKYKSLEDELSQVSPSTNFEKYSSILKEMKRIQDHYELFKKFDLEIKKYNEAKKVLEEENDEELIEIAKEEIEEARKNIEKLDQEAEDLLLSDMDDAKSVIVEIRAGAGGEEAALFVADLFKMYSKFAEKKGWKTQVIDYNETGLGGFKEIIFSVTGKMAYKYLKFESGVHRVQRIPITESGGRIHTSTASVAVLPEAEESDVYVDPKDIEVQTFRASGKGGQHVNRTESAVRIIHKPTGIIVQCQDERSQIQNRERAMSVLRAKLLEYEKQKQKEKEDEERRKQIGTAERAEKIRTYNFPQNRVTDHRIGISIFNIEAFMNGEIDEMVEALIADYKKKSLSNVVLQNTTQNQEKSD